jgi:RNA 3'-terminal phosphate cyclase (ATP)
MVEIDGSKGEGGGQMVRSSLALSAITGKPVRILNLRARRAKPGLARQHLTAVNAAAQICDAEVAGNELHSQEVTFVPSAVKAGEYHFRIGTAGSTTLVAQTVLPPLMLADGPSVVRVDGGTHNEKAPPFEHLQKVYLPLVQRMGPTFKIDLTRHGFYPVGGGRIEIGVTPTSAQTDGLRGLNLDRLIEKVHPSVRAIVSKIRIGVAERECEKIRRQSNWDANCFEAIEISDSPGPGNVVMILLQSEELT